MTLWYRYHHSGSGLIFGNHINNYYRDWLTYNFTLSKNAPYTDLQPDPIWTLNITDVLFNNETVKVSDTNLAVLDAYQRYLWVPKVDFVGISERLSKVANMECNNTLGVCFSRYVDCSHLCKNVHTNPEEWVWNPELNIGNFSFYIDDTMFSLPCESLVSSDPANTTGIMCLMLIDGSHDEFRFGIPFLESFTTSYHY